MIDEIKIAYTELIVSVMMGLAIAITFVLVFWEKLI